MDISIQTADLKYSRKINQLMHEWGYSAPHADTEKWLHELLNSTNHAVFLALAGDSLCGWVMVEKRISLASGFTAEITGLVVSTAYRRLRVGYQLVSAAEQWAQEVGMSHVVVRSNIQRDESHRFYPAIGFQRQKTSHVYTKQIKHQQINQ